jgi:hypothetical protein
MSSVFHTASQKRCTELSSDFFYQALDSRADTAKQGADMKADTAMKSGRYEGGYARYGDFQYVALSGEYLRICSCTFH